MHDRLRSVPGWLLIFDNADAADGHRAVAAERAAAAGIPGHVIVTTRRGGFAALGPVLDLDVIDLPDAVRMLRARVPDLGQADRGADRRGAGAAAAGAGAGRRLPGPLPDARPGVPGAAAQPRPPTCTPAARSAAGRTRSPRCGISAWTASAAESPAAVQLLGVCAYLAPEPIPLDLFTAHADLLPEPLSSAAADPLAFTDAIAVLVDYSLAKRTPAGLQLHRLVQATIRARHSSPARPAAARRQDSPMAEAARPGRRTDPLAVALGLLRADAPGQIMGAPQDWPRWAVLLPHVLAATGHARPRRRPAGPGGDGGRLVAAGPGRNLPAGARAAHRRQGHCWNGRWPSTRPPTAPTTPTSPPA